MTQRLPIPGADSGDWGDILNSFLEVSLASDGTLNSNTVGTNQLASNSVTNAQLDTPTQTILASVANKYTLPSGGIPYTDLAGNIPASSLSNSVQSSLTNAANAYVKPNTGIPATDLSTAVQTNLSSAATAIQPSTTLAGDLTGTLPNPTVAKLQGTTISSPTGGATSYLNATGTWTTPSGSTNASSIDGVAVTGSPSANQILTATSPTAAAWTTPTAGTSTLAADTDVSLTSPSNNQVLTYSTSTSKWINQTSPAGFTDPTTTKGDIIVHGTSTTTREAVGSDGQVLTADSTQSTGIKWTAAPSSSNATSSTPGLVQLDGDLGGIATSPSVVSINGITLPSSTPTTGNVLTASSSSATTWSTPAAGVTLDSTASDIQPLGTRSAGSLSTAAKADHVHPTTGLVTTSTSLSGDVTGTASATTVAKVNGVAVTGTPTTNQVLTATGSTTASWATLPASSISAAQALIPTTVKTSAYTASPGDFIPVDASSGSVTISLPSAPADKSRVEIKMVNTTSPNIVTFNTGGSDVLNKAGGSTTGTLTLLNQGVMLQYAATPAIWYVQSDDLPLSQVDARYLLSNGVIVSGTPSSGYVLTATSSTTASWAAQQSTNAIAMAVALG